jgi:hypothetical protein
VDERLRQAVIDLDRQFFRRYRPLNTFYYTGDRNKEYGYLDFLPAMRNFDILCGNRDRRIWDLAAGRPVPEKPDDSNLPEMPAVAESRGANEWLPAAKEQAAFRVDPRFEVNLFAGEEQFPEIANPIQCRWDSRGRLWVSTSQAYPHVYPGQEPHDRLVILEDTDGDGRADTSKVFADDLHLPLSFEFGSGGVIPSTISSGRPTAGSSSARASSTTRRSRRPTGRSGSGTAAGTATSRGRTGSRASAPT